MFLAWDLLIVFNCMLATTLASLPATPRRSPSLCLPLLLLLQCHPSLPLPLCLPCLFSPFFTSLSLLAFFGVIIVQRKRKFLSHSSSRCVCIAAPLIHCFAFSPSLSLSALHFPSYAVYIALNPSPSLSFLPSFCRIAQIKPASYLK